MAKDSKIVRPIFFAGLLPAETANEMVGVKHTYKLVDMEEGKIFCHYTIDGYPEMGSCFIAKEGALNHVNLPHMGGKCVCTFQKSGKGGF